MEHLEFELLAVMANYLTFEMIYKNAFWKLCPLIGQNVTITDKLFLVCFQIISDKSDFSLNPGPTIKRGTPSTFEESDEVPMSKFSGTSIFLRDPRTVKS